MAKMSELVLEIVDQFEQGIPSDVIAMNVNFPHDQVLTVIEEYFPTMAEE
jgi:hypothetical protein